MVVGENGAELRGLEAGKEPRQMTEKNRVYHRNGEPGGPACTVAVLPVSTKTADGKITNVSLLDAGPEATEVELLRTIASRYGVRWGHDEHGWWASVPDAAYPSWVVWRQDDNGNQFVVRANLTEAQARAMAKEYEELGHKQIYWVADAKCT